VNDRPLMLLYPHLVLEENRRELERERELRRKIRAARQQARSSRSSPLSRLGRALREAAGQRAGTARRTRVTPERTT
jgi:hypothetical protein